MPVSAISLAAGVQVPIGAELGRVAYEFGEVTVSVVADGKKVALVQFKGVRGLRVLDEGDLLEFWPSCSRPNGWLFQINEGGWLDLEASKAGFIREKYSAVREYLVTGDNECVSILADQAPTVTANAL